MVFPRSCGGVAAARDEPDRHQPLAAWLPQCDRGLLAVFACFVFPVVLAKVLERRLWLLPPTAFLPSIVFFIVTNFAMWLGSPVLYDRTLAGLVECLHRRRAVLPLHAGGRFVVHGRLFSAATHFAVRR